MLSSAPSWPSPSPGLPVLLLLTRKGCCLCEGLEQKLRALDPPLALELIDVDGDPALQARFGLEVPLLQVRPAREIGSCPGCRPGWLAPACRFGCRSTVFPARTLRKAPTVPPVP